MIVHCLASYMDSRLPASSHTLLHHSHQETKAFSGTHFYKHGEKPDVSVDHDVFALVQTGVKPTHYVIQVTKLLYCFGSLGHNSVRLW